jgi:signal transduction histidine kinase
LLLENNDILLEDSEEYIKIINSAAKNTLVLLDNLLNWAKSQTGQLSFNPEKILFSDVLQEIITLSKAIAKSKNITLECSGRDNLEIFVDVNMLKTVVRNLISNAIKFTNVGGHIKITAELKQDHVEITISDNGIGINKEKSNEIFNIASNTTTLGTANENGSGLGLVLCKEFIQKNNGDIWVESEENKGSNFIFTLPIYKA